MKDKFTTALRSGGHSLTAIRLGLFAYLEKSGPVSIHQMITDNPDLGDRASLYRTLALFRQLGVAEEVVMGGRRLIELTDSFDSHHHHLTCRRCGRTVPINSQEIEGLITRIATRNGFQSQSHHIEIDGLCTHCAAK